MKMELMNLIIEQNSVLEGRLIQKPIESYIEKLLKHANILTYSEGGCMSGFIAYYCNDKEKEMAFLTMLCVSQASKKKGLGKYLLKCSISDLEAKGFTKYQLEVEKDNFSATNLYVKFGFNVIEEIGNIFKMEKQLSNFG